MIWNMKQRPKELFSCMNELLLRNRDTLLHVEIWKKNIPLFSQTTLQVDTGKSLPEAVILASTNPQYDKRLFIELQVQCMEIPS